MNKPGLKYWLVAAVLSIWAMAYGWLVTFTFMLATPADFNELVESGRILPEYRDYVFAIPDWAIALTGLAAITRIGGAVGLLLRRRWSFRWYLWSLACVVILMYRGFFVSNVAEVIRPSQIAVEILFLLLSFFAVGFSFWAGRQGYFIDPKSKGKRKKTA